MNYITDKEIDAIQGDMGETLRKQPRVRMRIEGSGYWEGGINGWFFRVRRGEETELPKSIAELIQRSEQVAVMGEREVKAVLGVYKAGLGAFQQLAVVKGLVELGGTCGVCGSVDTHYFSPSFLCPYSEMRLPSLAARISLSFMRLNSLVGMLA